VGIRTKTLCAGAMPVRAYCWLPVMIATRAVISVLFGLIFEWDE
jgi:hypothetical protein